MEKEYNYFQSSSLQGQNYISISLLCPDMCYCWRLYIERVARYYVVIGEIFFTLFYFPRIVWGRERIVGLLMTSFFLSNVNYHFFWSCSLIRYKKLAFYNLTFKLDRVLRLVMEDFEFPSLWITKLIPPA